MLLNDGVFIGSYHQFIRMTFYVKVFALSCNVSLVSVIRIPNWHNKNIGNPLLKPSSIESPVCLLSRLVLVLNDEKKNVGQQHSIRSDPSSL